MNGDTWTSLLHVRPPSLELRNQVLNWPVRLSCHETYARPPSPPTIAGNTCVDPVVSVGRANRSVQLAPPSADVRNHTVGGPNSTVAALYATYTRSDASTATTTCGPR